MLKIFSIFNNIVKLGIILDVPTLLTEINTNKAQLWSSTNLELGHRKIHQLNVQLRLEPVWAASCPGHLAEAPVQKIFN